MKIMMFAHVLRRVAALSVFFLGAAAAAPLPIDDASLLRQMPGAGIEYRLPERVYPPELVALLRDGDPVYRKLLYRSTPAQAAKWTAVPLERWAELISDFAPASLEGNTGNPNTMGLSPFTGRLFAGAEMSHEDFLSNPFQARERGTDVIIYAREADMPEDYPARPNHTENIPHLDGTTHPYLFFVPEDHRDAGPEVGSNRKHWFCPAGEVWRVRLGIIAREVIPDLSAAILLNDNRDAVRTLAAILDRLGEVYPGLPVYTGVKAHGFARNRAGTDYLTVEEYRSIAPEQPFIHVRDRADYPFWYRDIYDFSFSKLHYGVSAWTDGVMDLKGWIAGAFDLIRDQPETRAWSAATHGDPAAWEARLRERLLPELEFLALATPPTTGNTSYAYITGSVKAGISLQNAALFAKGLEIIERYMYNNWLPDGKAADAAFNYAMMTHEGMLGLSWLNTFFGGVDLADRYPLKRTIDALGYNTVRTLLGIVSKHADQHAWIFRGGGPGPDPAALDYTAHQASQCFPNYGLSVLRGGLPGRRLELIFDHQNAPQHTHRSRFNLQLFHEGVDCLPDYGYTIGFIDPERAPWSEITTDYELMGLPNTDTDRWGPWKWGFTDKPEAHNVLMVDQWLHATNPTQLHGFAGADSPEDPGWWAQFAEADAASLFANHPNPVDIYRRQVTVLTLPDGAPLAVDIFRVRGGRQHDLFWHVPGDTPELPGPATALEAASLAEYFGQAPNYYRFFDRTITIHHYGRAPRLITNLASRPLPAAPWAAEWSIEPSRTFPRPPERRNYGNWETLLKDVRLGLWSYVAGSPAESELLSARSPWPGFLAVTDPETGREIRATVGLKDAMDTRILSRRAAEPGLVSTFVHALATRTPGETPALTDFTVSEPLDLEAGGGLVCRLDLADGTAGFLGSTLGAGRVETPDLALTGRLGAAFPDAGRLALYDGVALRAGGWGVDLEPGWEMALTGIEGDLTGDPLRHALIVTSPTPLPATDTLNGRHVTVWHGVSEHLQTVYTIAGIEDLGDGRWRLLLAGAPPFILQRANVLKIDPDDRRKMEQDFQFLALIGGSRASVDGRRIRFPRTGFETSLESAGRSAFTVGEVPPEDMVAPGDPFVVYTIQAGDRVTIPSFFACTGERDAAGSWTLRVNASGPARLTVPGRFARALAGDAVLLVEPDGVGSRVTLPAGRHELRWVP